MFFKQCMMHRRQEGLPGVSVHVAWIPEELAKVGKVLELLDSHTGEWTGGWVVESVHSRLSEEYVREHENDYKHQRKASDV